MKCADLETILNPLYHLIDARVGVCNKLISLKGRMDLIVSQVSHYCNSSRRLSRVRTSLFASQVESRWNPEARHEMSALLVYRDGTTILLINY